jgi:hypothetical protein
MSANNIDTDMAICFAVEGGKRGDEVPKENLKYQNRPEGERKRRMTMPITLSPQVRC